MNLSLLTLAVLLLAVALPLGILILVWRGWQRRSEAHQQALADIVDPPPPPPLSLDAAWISVEASVDGNVVLRTVFDGSVGAWFPLEPLESGSPRVTRDYDFRNPRPVVRGVALGRGRAGWRGRAHDSGGGDDPRCAGRMSSWSFEVTTCDPPSSPCGP